MSPENTTSRSSEEIRKQQAELDAMLAETAENLRQQREQIAVLQKTMGQEKSQAFRNNDQEIKDTQQQIQDILETSEEAKKFSETDKEKISWGVGTIGFKVEKMKNDLWGKGFNKLTNIIGEDRTVGKFCKEMRDSFVRDGQEAIKKANNPSAFNASELLGVHVGGTTKKMVSNVGLFVGNIAKYGRMVADATGASIANPFRYVMMGGMVTARAAEAGKEVRLNSEEVLDKTRIQDVYDAEEEAYAIYKAAKAKAQKAGDEDVSAEALKNAYLMEMPKNIMERLKNTDAASGFIQDILKKDIETGLYRLDDKVYEIEIDSKLSETEKESAIEHLILKQRKKLEDYDRMVTQYGTVDEIAMSLRYAQKLGKAIVAGMQIETAVVSVEKLWGALSHLLSSHGAAVIIPSTHPSSHSEEHVITSAKINSGIDTTHQNTYWPTKIDTSAHAEIVKHDSISSNNPSHIQPNPISQHTEHQETKTLGHEHHNSIKHHHVEKTHEQRTRDEQLKKLQEKLEGQEPNAAAYHYDFDTSKMNAYQQATGIYPTFTIDENGAVKLPDGTILGYSHDGDITINPDGTLNFNGDPSLPKVDLTAGSADQNTATTNPPPVNMDDDRYVDEYGNDVSNPQLANLQEHLEGRTGLPIDNQVNLTPKTGAFANNTIDTQATNVSVDTSLDAQTPITEDAINNYQPQVFIGSPADHVGGGISADIPDPRDINAGEVAVQHIQQLHSLETHNDVIERLGHRNVIIERPHSDMIQGISHEDYTNAYDYKVIQQEHMVFSSYHQYEKDRLLQQLFGKARGGVEYNKKLDKNIFGIRMTYYRDDTPTWESTNRIPAKYFFSGSNRELLADPNVSKADLEVLQKAGVLNDRYEFVNQKELATVSKAYAKFDVDNSKPIGNESIERYISRLTRNMHQAKDGTFFIAKPGTDIDELLRPKSQGAINDPTIYGNAYEGNGFTTPVRLTYDNPWRINIAERASRRLIRDVVGRRWGR
jgi:hypothetical protein